MSDELFFPTGAYALWCAQGEPVVESCKKCDAKFSLQFPDSQ